MLLLGRKPRGLWVLGWPFLGSAFLLFPPSSFLLLLGSARVSLLFCVCVQDYTALGRQVGAAHVHAAVSLSPFSLPGPAPLSLSLTSRVIGVNVWMWCRATLFQVWMLDCSSRAQAPIGWYSVPKEHGVLETNSAPGCLERICSGSRSENCSFCIVQVWSPWWTKFLGKQWFGVFDGQNPWENRGLESLMDKIPGNKVIWSPCWTKFLGKNWETQWFGILDGQNPWEKIVIWSPDGQTSDLSLD